MKIKNATPFPFGVKLTSRRPPQPEATLVLRARYTLGGDGALALPGDGKLAAQGAMSAETYAEDDADRRGACIYPGDFADWKPRTDVMVRGTCHTPFGKPLVECPVRVEVGSFSKILRVIGRRSWSDDGKNAAMSEPLAFTKMPVDYAHAYGGEGYAANPIGKGAHGLELPNVEHAGEIVQRRRDDLGPAGFAPLSPIWTQRASKVGREYGSGYRKDRWPYYADDFDWSHFNAAPVDQQLEGALRGDERLLFQNLHPTSQLLESRLPGLRVRVFVNDVKRRFREVPMRLDTLFVDLEEGELYLTWRGVERVERDDFEDVKTILVANEPLADAPLPELDYRDRLEAFEADPKEIASHVSPELLEAFEAMKKRQAKPPVSNPADAPNPVNASLRAMLDKMPAPLPNQVAIEAAVADAVARFSASAPKEAKAEESLAKIANDIRPSNEPRRSAMPLRAGGPPPARASNAVKEAFERMAEERKKAGEKADPETQAKLAELDAEMEELKAKPLFRAMLERPGYRAPAPNADLNAQDYEGRDLRGVDLRGARLRDASFAYANLEGARLDGADLEGAILSGANLTDADLSSTNLTLVNFTGAQATRATFAGAKLDRAFLHRAVLREAKLTGASGRFVFLSEADLEGADLGKLELFRAFGKGVKLGRAKAIQATFTRCQFFGANGVGLVLDGAHLHATSFAFSELSFATAVGARGDRTVWNEATLDDADFSRAIFPRALLLGVKASRARFRRSILKDARCRGANFDGADFTESQLFGVDFCRAHLEGTVFRGACLYDAKLMKAAGARSDFTGANLTRARFEET